jgi:hypothetical protein
MGVLCLAILLICVDFLACIVFFCCLMLCGCFHIHGMAYGNGKSKKEYMRRSIEIGCIDLSQGGDVAVALMRLRQEALPLSDKMAKALWCDDPLVPYLDGKAVDRVLLRVQAEAVINSVWAESRRMVVKPALSEQEKRRRRYMFGLLRNAAKNVPLRVAVAAGRVEMHRVLDALSKTANNQLLDTARILGGPVIEALKEKACAKYPCPSWSNPRTSVVVSLDHRSLRNGQCGERGYRAILGEMTRGIHEGQRWSGSLVLNGIVARGPSLSLPVVLSPGACRRALRGVDAAQAQVGALTMTIGERYAVVRAVLVVPKGQSVQLVRYVVSRDFGYRNTASLAVVDLGDAYAIEQAQHVASSLGGLEGEEAKKAAKQYLEANVAPEAAQVVDAQVWSGRGFMARLHALATQIDGLRAEIDLVYNRMAHLRATVNRALGRDISAVLEENMLIQGVLKTEEKTMDKDVITCVSSLPVCVQRAYKRFFKLLEVVRRLKEKRLAVYRQADGVKRSWLGFVSNKEVALASKWGAVVVREDLDVVTPERESPEYKGRTFNKMINAGCKGRYTRVAAGKFEWLGIAHMAVPSYYTSSTDVRYGVVDKDQRRGEVFTARVDGQVMHADVHAAAVIGLWPFLVPKGKASAEGSMMEQSAQTIVRKPFFVPSVVQAFGKGSLVL